MLNLARLFEDAVHVMREHAEALRVPPLPATVFMLQQDVINHYDYALTHYLDQPLDAPYLQQSSLGSPYEKWARFTNDDFHQLAFSIANLVRYTARLGHETEHARLGGYARRSERRQIRIDYTSLISAGPERIGLRVEPGHEVVIVPFATTPDYLGAI